MVTIQYEQVVARRGQMTTTVKERSFKTDDAMAKWVEKAQETGKIGQVLRYSYEAK